MKRTAGSKDLPNIYLSLLQPYLDCGRTDLSACASAFHPSKYILRMSLGNKLNQGHTFN